MNEIVTLPYWQFTTQVYLLLWRSTNSYWCLFELFSQTKSKFRNIQNKNEIDLQKNFRRASFPIQMFLNSARDKTLNRLIPEMQNWIVNCQCINLVAIVSQKPSSYHQLKRSVIKFLIYYSKGIPPLVRQQMNLIREQMEFSWIVKLICGFGVIETGGYGTATCCLLYVKWSTSNNYPHYLSKTKKLTNE